MTDESLQAVAVRWISLWTPPVDWALFDRLHDPAFEDAAAGGRTTDRAGFAEGLRAFTDAFPDLCASVDDLVVDRDAAKVAVRWSAVGTNRRSFLGIGPTQRRTRFRGIEIIEIRDGRIVRRWGEWDASDHAAVP